MFAGFLFAYYPPNLHLQFYISFTVTFQAFCAMTETRIL